MRLRQLNESQRELENFQVKISLDTAHDTYGVWREGSHDDLVLAVTLALWVGVASASRTPTRQTNYLR